MPETGGILHDLAHDATYVENHLLDGDFLRKELHDTWWNLTHLHTGAYHILHGLFTLFLVYCAIGACLKRYVLGVVGFPKVLPHVEFWAEFPELVLEGMVVAKSRSGTIFGGREHDGMRFRGGRSTTACGMRFQALSGGRSTTACGMSGGILTTIYFGGCQLCVSEGVSLRKQKKHTRGLCDGPSIRGRPHRQQVVLLHSSSSSQISSQWRC